MDRLKVWVAVIGIIILIIGLYYVSKAMGEMGGLIGKGKEYAENYTEQMYGSSGGEGDEPFINNPAENPLNPGG